MTNNKGSKLLLCAAGIFVCYFYFAMLQEKITRGQYGDVEPKEKFTYMFALVFFQCLVNYAFAKILLLATFKEGEDTTRTVYYATSALTYLLGMVCSNMALQFVNYPTQVVGKAGKPIPVMILGVLLGKKVTNEASQTFGHFCSLSTVHHNYSKCFLTFPGISHEEVLFRVAHCHWSHSVHVQGQQDFKQIVSGQPDGLRRISHTTVPDDGRINERRSGENARRTQI